MQKTYDAPELKLIGEANEVVMGSMGPTGEMIALLAPDFEFEQDEL